MKCFQILRAADVPEDALVAYKHISKTKHILDIQLLVINAVYMGANKKYMADVFCIYVKILDS